MRNILNEIRQLSQKGMEHCVISGDRENKDLFIEIMLKSEMALKKLDEPSTKEYKTRTYDKIDENLKFEMLLVAYCFSTFEHTSLYPNDNQDKAFNKAAEELGVKKTTLKNARDWFDGHNDNHRSGWWQQDLPDDMQKFKDIYDKKNRKDILEEARAILNLPETQEKNFGLNLKNERFKGQFRKKEEVEEFIKIVLDQSPTPAKDLVEQCSKGTFKKCFNYFADNYTISTEKLAKQITKYDGSSITNTEFSLWIKARFIQEIFRQRLEKDAMSIVSSN